jgi:GcrA cell cycle regulator
MPGMDWTGQQIQELRKLWAEGLSTRRIGERMGISKNAVVGKAHRLGLPERESPVLRGDRSPDAVSKREATKAKAVELYQGGMQRAQIAARLELNPDYVSNLLRGVSQGKGRPSVMAPGLGLPTMHAEPTPMHDSRPAMHDRAPAAPLVQFRPIQPRCCKWPLWGHQERPTHRYCERPTTTRKDGLPDVYCAEHRAKATAKTLWYATAPRFAA